MQTISWLFVFEGVVIVTGNIITIVIFTTTPRLRSRQYVLIVSLAVADLLVGFVSLPMNIVFDEMHQVGFVPPSYKTAYFVLDFSIGTASLIGLSALAVERAHATYCPFKHSTLSKGSYIFAIVLIWIMVPVVGAVSFTCYMLDTEYYIWLKVVTVVTALMVIIIAYLIIFINVRCMATATIHASHQGNKKLTVTLAIVTGISLVTWLPYPVLVYCAKFIVQASSEKTFFLLRSISKVLHYSNSLANVFIYSFRMREFKREILRQVGCGIRNHITPRNGEEKLGNIAATSGFKARRVNSTSNC